MAPERAREVLELLDGLPALERWPEPRVVLGYRGCWLRGTNQGAWLAYDGVVVYEPHREARASGGARAWRDEARVVERAILATAPKELLPETLVAG